MMRAIITGVYLLLIVCCDQKPFKKTEKKNQADKEVKDGIIKTNYADGTLKSEVPVKNGKRNGVAVSYYASGKKQLEIPYTDGKREGVVKSYYENGNLYEETTYVNDQMHGLKRKYKQDGKLAAEVSYHKDQPCIGLREYLNDGLLKKKYPTIVVTPVDQILRSSKYTLRITMTDNIKGVKFYVGKLENGCLTDDLDPVRLAEKGVGEIDYYLPAGSFIMEEINIVAKFNTAGGNPCVTQRKYNLAVENRL
jgi:hypothetical protein